jgi:hypothetical protein
MNSIIFKKPPLPSHTHLHIPLRQGNFLHAMPRLTHATRPKRPVHPPSTHIPNIRAPSLIYHLLSTVSQELPYVESESRGMSRVCMDRGVRVNCVVEIGMRRAGKVYRRLLVLR